MLVSRLVTILVTRIPGGIDHPWLFVALAASFRGDCGQPVERVIRMGKGKKDATESSDKVEWFMPKGFATPLEDEIKEIMARQGLSFEQKTEEVGKAALKAAKAKYKSPAYVAFQSLDIWKNSSGAIYDSWKDGFMATAHLTEDDAHSVRVQFGVCKRASEIVVTWCDDVFKAIDPTPLLRFEEAFNSKWASMSMDQLFFDDLYGISPFFISDERLELVFREAWLTCDRIEGATARQFKKDFHENITENLGASDKSSGRMPKNPEVVALCQKLADAATRLAKRRTSESEIAFQFAGESAKSLAEQQMKASSLLRQARRYPHLWKAR